MLASFHDQFVSFVLFTMIGVGVERLVDSVVLVNLNGGQANYKNEMVEIETFVRGENRPGTLGNLDQSKAKPHKVTTPLNSAPTNHDAESTKKIHQTSGTQFCRHQSLPHRHDQVRNCHPKTQTTRSFPWETQTFGTARKIGSQK